MDPHKTHEPHAEVRQQYTLTAEEIRILKECNRESLYRRCVPLAFVSSIAVHQAVRMGYLKAHPRFGSTLKVLSISFVSYVIGKISYQGKCEEKFLRLENSRLADAIRQRRGIISPQRSSLSEGTSDQQQQGNQMIGATPLEAKPPSQSLDTFHQNATGELDDYKRPSLDRDTLSNSWGPQDSIPSRTSGTTYDDLRMRNRIEFDTKQTQYRSQALGHPLPQREPPSSNLEGQTSVEPESSSISDSVPSKKNKYGDAWVD